MGAGALARHGSGASLPVRTHDGGQPPAARIWSLRALKIDGCGNPPRFGALIHTEAAATPGATTAQRVHPRRIPDSEAFEQARPRLDAFLADSPVISVDPGQLDTRVLAAEYWRELWRAEGFTTTRTPALPDLESAAPGRTLLDIGRGHLAAAHGLGWRRRPGHAARGSERGRAA